MRARGFTLIEMVVAMGIAGILAVMAFPAYRTAMHRAQRLDARLALQRIQYLQEKHYAQYLRYAAQFGGASGSADMLAMPDRSDSGNYSLQVTTAGDGQAFLATAQARTDGRQADDLACRQLAVDEAGQQRSADAAGHWSTADPQRCWG